MNQDWWDLVPFWSILEQAASERDAQKRSFRSSRYWNEKSHFIGLIGEAIVSLETGWPLDWNLRIEGDGGIDFPDIDVKTSTFWNDPHLKHPMKAKFWPAFFVLVAVNLDDQRAKLCGYATRDEMKSASLTDYGYGLQHHLPSSQLHKGVPND